MERSRRLDSSSGPSEPSAARSSSSRSKAGRSSTGLGGSTPRPASRLDSAPIETCMEYLSRPHTSWDSATKELARLESRRQHDDDARSCASTVSAYSIKSSSSAVSSSSSLRRGHMAMLPSSQPRSRTASEPPPAVDLSVGGTSVGGFSFVAPRSSSTASSVAGSSGQRLVSQATSAAAGLPAGRSGAVRVQAGPVVHPQSAPAGPQPMGRIPVKPAAAPGAAPQPDSYSFNGFVPRMAPKKR
jgi:hypothetical protein